jgi:TolB-like protein/tetratricopeptide (TPR) repeat protein
MSLSRLNRALGELNRRKVYRLAGVYVIGGWFLLQVADALLNLIDAPDGAFRMIALVLVLAFPLALVLAWVYDITPEGVVRTKSQEAVAPEAAAGWNWRWLDYAIIVVLLAILVYVLVPDRKAHDGGMAQSIAVLPFADLSPGANNRHFSDGLTEALMDSLARIPGLQVASRTSSFAFRDPGPSVRDVAVSLNVSNLLEGSVRKAGNQLKVNVRLVDGVSGRRLWSETFDASMEDIFAVQETIARGIADALKIRLLGGELLVPIPTRDLGAYEEYLRGRNQLRGDGTMASLDQALVHFEAALEIDPQFTLALAGICTAHWEKYGITRDALLGEQAIGACREAERRLDSTVEVLVALGGLYRSTGELTQSLEILQEALAVNPNDADVHAGLGETLRASGDLDAAALHHRRAIELDPAFWRHHWELGAVLTENGQPGEAVAYFNRAIRLQPDSPAPYYSLGAAYFLMGEFLKAADAFRESIRRNPNPQAYANSGTLYFYAGDYVQAEEMFQQAAALSPGDYRYHAFLADAIGMQEQRAKSDSAVHFATAIRLARQQLEINPREYQTRAALAMYLAQTGNREQAEAELERLERAGGLDMSGRRAMGMAYLFLGRHEAAVGQFQAAVEEGFPPSSFQLDPRLQTLASIPEFRALLEGDATLE